MAQNGSLQPLEIVGYTDEEFKKPLSGKSYTVMINPESIKWSRSIAYNKETAQDTGGEVERYLNTPMDNLSFDIVIDCTGIVDQKKRSMKKEIAALERIVFNYNGKIHRPNFVKIHWGTLVFQSVLKSFNTTYTLFKPDGSPLRAKISLSFGKYVSAKDLEKQKKKTSPDVSHLVQVVQGNTLPELCEKVWNDPYYYIQVAKFNGLNKFRCLKGGEQLIFPPIVKSM